MRNPVLEPDEIVDFKDDLLPCQRQWLDAMASGRYRKTKGQLSRDPRYNCALGVAARELAGRSDWFNHDGDLPADLSEQLQLFSESGVFRPGYGVDTGTALPQRAVTDLNDDTNLSLVEIGKLFQDAPWLVFRNIPVPPKLDMGHLKEKYGIVKTY